MSLRALWFEVVAGCGLGLGLRSVDALMGLGVVGVVVWDAVSINEAKLVKVDLACFKKPYFHLMLPAAV